MDSNLKLQTTHYKLSTQRGFFLVEVILASAVFVLLVTALVGAYLYGQESTALAGNRARANMLAEEGLEAARNIRDAGYSNLADGTYGLTTTGNQWNLSGSQDISDVFTRQVVISSIDSKRKLVTANVTWQQNPQRTGAVSLATRFTNWIVSSGGDWAFPLQQSQIDLVGTNNGTKVQVLGNYVYVIRNGGVNFMVVDVSNPATPTVAGSLTLPGTPQNIYVLGNYAYVASGNDSTELQIINISNPSSPAVVGNFDAVGGGNAVGIYVSGTTAYLVRVNSAESEFIIINVSTPSTPSLLGSLELGVSAYEVVVSGTNAYIASESDTQELQVVNVAVPSSPSVIGSVNLAGSTGAITVAISGSIVLLGQGSTIFTIDVATPSLPLQSGLLAVGGVLNDISLNLSNANSYAYIATSDNANEFKVINITNPATPALLSQVNITGSNPLFGAAYDATLDRAFVVGQSDAQELVIIMPQ